jgi:hypothetical protein
MTFGSFKVAPIAYRKTQILLNDISPPDVKRTFSVLNKVSRWLGLEANLK